MEVDLLMECADDDLSPWQREANRQAEKEYHAAIEKIKHARAQAEATAKQQMAVQPLPSPPRIVTPREYEPIEHSNMPLAVLCLK